MKKIILGLTLVIISGLTLAQSLSNTNLVITPSVFSTTALVANVDITNNTTSDKEIICQRISNVLAINPAYPTIADSGHLSNFCWDQCYPTWVDLSGPLTVTANSTNSVSFVGDLETHGVEGTSTVTYSFYVQGNPNDQTTLPITYNFTTGVTTIGGSKAGLSSARPNPADAFTTISYSLKGNPSAYKIEIVNMLGKKFAQYSLSGKNGVMTIPTNELSSGVYFYVLKENGKTISSQKLVVSHK